MNELRDEMIKWRHDIHKYPELGFYENRTAKKIENLLKSFGVETHANIGGTGVVGVTKKW